MLELHMREHGVIASGRKKGGPFKHKGFVDQSGGGELYPNQNMMGYTGQAFFKN